jgi:cell fate regulator YaaT (PSP1 superfamily)
MSYRRLYRFNAGSLAVARGDLVLVDQEGSLTAGTVDSAPIEVGEEEVTAAMPRVARVATDADRERIARNHEREREAYALCKERIAGRGMPMKLVRARMLFDGSKVVFYFTSEGRVDFRELVKDLAYRLRMRIEMMQIGVRDEAKLLGGYGLCGQPMCCSAWIDDFCPVSIRMAKDQNLSLNPTKVSGVCGRLMCCLAYEHPVYQESGKGMPKLGKRVVTPQGRGRVTRLDVLARKVFVALEDGQETIVTPEEITIAPPPPPQAPKPRE